MMIVIAGLMDEGFFWGWVDSCGVFLEDDCAILKVLTKIQPHNEQIRQFGH
jgi:hypothetical protein